MTSAPQKRRPVLFVHGHNPDDANDADFNYRKNLVQAVNGLPSFQLTLDDPAKTATLESRRTSSASSISTGPSMPQSHREMRGGGTMPSRARSSGPCSTA